MNSVITARKLMKRFGSVVAVDDVSFDVRRGEMLALVGPDGAGKTTMIRMFCGIIAPDGGELSVLGIDLRLNYDSIKHRIGYLSQRFSLYGDLTVDENIEFFADLHGVVEYRKRRDELLRYMRLIDYRDRLAERLSGGMKQKLALACTLTHTPELIFLDEPTTGVDPVSRRDFWKILSDLLKNGITIVMTTPYLDEAERCSRVGLMNQGRIILLDTPQKLKNRMTDKIIEIIPTDLRASYAILRGMKEIKEVQAFGDRLHIVVPDAAEADVQIGKLLADKGITVGSWRYIDPSLENVFISLLRSD